MSGVCKVENKGESLYNKAQNIDRPVKKLLLAMNYEILFSALSSQIMGLSALTKSYPG